MIALLTLAALAGQTIPPVPDVRLDLTAQQAAHIEALAEKLCPQAFSHGERPLQWLAPVAKQESLTDSEQVFLMSNCVLNSQGRLDEKRLEPTATVKSYEQMSAFHPLRT